MERALRAAAQRARAQQRLAPADSDGHLGELVAEGEAAMASPGGKVAAMAAKFSGAGAGPPPPEAAGRTRSPGCIWA